MHLAGKAMNKKGRISKGRGKHRLLPIHLRKTRVLEVDSI